MSSYLVKWVVSRWASMHPFAEKYRRRSRNASRWNSLFSVNCDTGSVEKLAEGLPQPKVGVTTVGEIRAAGGDVIRTSGRTPYHATVTGMGAARCK